MDDRRKALEAFSKQLAQGLPFAEEFIPGLDNDVANNALLARNLSEDALAHQVLKNTGVPVPNKGASVSKQEDFLNRIVKESYPEIDPNVRLGATGGVGQYYKGDIIMNKLLAPTMSTEETVGKVLHEAGHQYDDKKLKYIGPNLDLKLLRDAKKSGIDLKNADPAQAYEILAKGHHARIPNLRDADSYGMGALKSLMKSGTFKGIAPVLAKGALAAGGGAFSLASEAADSPEAGDTLGQDAFEREMGEQVRRSNALKSVNPEQKQAFTQMYNELDAGQAFDPRRDALRKLTGK